MLRKLLIGLAILAGLAAPVQAAGTIPGFSLTQQIGSSGVPMVGCKLYIIQAGTTSTPQSGYSDSGLTLPLSNPVICDGYGRLPQIFVADGNIKVRLTTSGGTQILTQDGILVIGASSGGGGGSPVDATTILATGDHKIRYGTGNLTGFVRCNGRTIGSATSGATERANADAQSLFEYLWAADSNLSVSTGRGGSANADWVANKTLTLPDCRGRALAGLDDMGNAAAGRLTSTYFGATGGCSSAVATTLGVACGGESHTLTLGQLPSGITSSGTFTASDNTFVKSTNDAIQISFNSSGVSVAWAWSSGATMGRAAPAGPMSVTSNNTNGNPHANVQPTILLTVYIKL